MFDYDYAVGIILVIQNIPDLLCTAAAKAELNFLVQKTYLLRVEIHIVNSHRSLHRTS